MLKKTLFIAPFLLIIILIPIVFFSVPWEKKPLSKRQKSSAFAPFLSSLSPAPIPITLAAVGDISLSRAVNWQMQKGSSPFYPFLKTAAILRSADLTIGNLEGPLVKSCLLTTKGMVFCGAPTNAAGLAFAGFDLINLTNNHIHNYGGAGIQNTIAALASHKISYFGLNTTATRQIKNTALIFLGFDDTLKPIKKSEMSTKIKEAKTKADLVIINFHWGIEYQKQPSGRQQGLAHLAIDAGADLIIGHHPHVLQPVEYYRGRPILYSLGNFVFDQPWSEETMIGAIALITIENKQVTAIDFVPVQISQTYQPAPLLDPQKSEIINHLLP